MRTLKLASALYRLEAAAVRGLALSSTTSVVTPLSEEDEEVDRPLPVSTGATVQLSPWLTWVIQVTT